MGRDMVTRTDNQTKKAKQQKSGNHQQAEANDQQKIGQWIKSRVMMFMSSLSVCTAGRQARQGGDVLRVK